MNKVILMGRLTADPSIRYRTDTGAPVASYTLAVDRGKEEADFIRCVAFDKNAEFARDWLRKATKILIEGSIRTGSYTNREGQKVYTTDVIVARHEFAESANASGSGGAAAAASPADHSAAPPSGGQYPGFMDIPDGVDDESLPFN